MSDLDRIERLCAEIEALAEKAKEYAGRIGDNAAFANVAGLLLQIFTAVPALVAHCRQLMADRAALMRVARAAALVPGKSYAEPDSWDDPPLIGKAVVYIDRDLVKAIAAEVAALPAARLAQIKEMKDG